MELDASGNGLRTFRYKRLVRCWGCGVVKKFKFDPPTEGEVSGGDTC